MTRSFTIPLQPLDTTTGTQSSEPLSISAQLWDALMYWHSCSEEDEEEAAAFVRQLLELQQKGIHQDAH